MAKQILRAKVKKEVKQFLCLICGCTDYKSFYMSKNPKYIYNGKIPYCKTCLQENYMEHLRVTQNDYKRSVILACEFADIPFNEKVFNDSALEIEKTNNDVFLTYMKYINLLISSSYRSKKELLSFDKTLMYPDMENLIIEEETSDDDIIGKNNFNKEEEKELVYSEEFGQYFTENDIKYLEKYMDGLKKDYRINTTNHLDYAKKIAMASLALNQLQYDLVNGRCDEKMYKARCDVFDMLCKSAKFAEVNRTNAMESFSSLGEIIDLVENKEWIPIYEPIEKDTYDLLISQFANIEKSV